MSAPKSGAARDPLAEPAASRFLRVINHELVNTIAPELTSARSRSVLELMTRVLEHLIAREDHLGMLLERSTQCGRAFLDSLGEADDAYPGSSPDIDALQGAAPAFGETYCAFACHLEAALGARINELRDLAPPMRERTWCAIKELLESEGALYAELERRERSVSVAASQRRPASAVYAAAIARYLNRRAGAHASIEVEELVVPLGGFSKDIFVIKLTGRGRPADGIVLRCDAQQGPVEGSVANEYTILKAMYDAGVPTPEPLWLETDSAVLGRPFLVMRRVPGNTMIDIKNEPIGNGVVPGLRQLARILAKIHSVDPRCAGISGVDASRPTEQHVLRLLETFEDQWLRRRLGPSPTIAAGIAWMKANIPERLPAPRIVHGDAQLRNLLFEDGQASAMLDWETWHLGDPGEDLAYCRALEVERFMPWEDFLAEYAAGGGPEFTAQSARFWGMWVYLRGAITSVSMMGALCTDPPPDIRIAFGGPHYTAFCIRRVSEFMQTL